MLPVLWGLEPITELNNGHPPPIPLRSILRCQWRSSRWWQGVHLFRWHNDASDNVDGRQRNNAKHQPDYCINAAAYTAVDKAETETGLAGLINAQAPAVLAEAAKALGAA